MRCVAVVLVWCACSGAVGQTGKAPVLIDEQTAKQHELVHIDAVYPPIARLAHVDGEVKIQVRIDESGRVAAETVLSGPPMLVGAATDAVRKWTYTPFLQDGQAEAATTVVTVRFNLSAWDKEKGQIHSSAEEQKGDAVVSKYSPAAFACQEASQKKNPAKTAAACRHAAEIAETFPPDVRFVERRSAFVMAATADLQNQENPEALEYAKKAVAVVEMGHDDGSGECAAYATLAEAEAVTNDLADADRDFTKAEDAERGAVEMIQSDGLKTSYRGTLKAVLSWHARVLIAMKKSEAAQAKLDEAAKL